MRIGLLRHFPVPHSLTEWVDGLGFAAWSEWYDVAPTRPTPARAGLPWACCVTSDLPRARATAQARFSGPVTATPLLREVPFGVALPGRVVLPVAAWQAASRVAWWWQRPSVPEVRHQTIQRAHAAAAWIVERAAGGDTLVVSHGFFLRALTAALRRHGFHGQVPLRPLNGEVYVLQRDAAVRAPAAHEAHRPARGAA